MTRQPRSDRGETLLEVLLALLVVSLGVVALMTGLATSIAGSSAHRNLSTLDTVLKNFAETAKYQIELESSPAPIFTPCATYTNLPSPSYGSPGSYTAINYTPPSHYTVSIVNIAYWNNAPPPAQSGWISQPTCTTLPTSQAGDQLQLLTVTATGPTGTQSMSFGVRPQ
jgi:Tfp pilus assembly protein PilV